MTTTVRVGVTGLGRRWQMRYRPALLAQRQRFQLRALHDQVQARAAREAQLLGCDAAAGLTELLQRDDVDALLVADAQWFGLWPVEAACRAGKPVCCGVPIEVDDAHADTLQERIQASGLPVMAALLPRFCPATARLRELLASELGRARLLVVEVTRPRPQASLAGVGLLDWCAQLMGDAPAQAQAVAVDATTFAGLLLEFPGGRAAQISCWYSPGVGPSVRLRVVAERGWATVRLPDRLSWSAADGVHGQRLRAAAPPVQALLEAYHAAFTEGRPPSPTWADAYRALGWRRHAERSRRDGQPVAMP